MSTDNGCSRSSSSVDKEGQPARAREKKPVGRYRRESRPGKEQANISPCSGPRPRASAGQSTNTLLGLTLTGHWGRERGTQQDTGMPHPRCGTTA